MPLFVQDLSIFEDTTTMRFLQGRPINLKRSMIEEVDSESACLRRCRLPERKPHGDPALATQKGLPVDD